MNSKMKNLLNEIFFSRDFTLNEPKLIKVTSDFYNYLSARHKENIYLENDHSYIVSYFKGITIVVDDTINGPYEFEY